MKIILKVFGLVSLVLLIMTIFVGIAAYYIGDKGAVYKRIDFNNYDGTYSTALMKGKCRLGNEFKLLHQRISGIDTNDFNTSYCKWGFDNNLSGYIYPKNNPRLRLFWLEQNGQVAYD
ncbi:hypothetical protein K6Y31_20200 [Motilimonas cestriensis]|uniref:Uncharacterized protein n=1 Tax=Motilimonas cestriensis TaxID=2742685 RepID=A0ABS8WF32_9GAMM|nr:hypothetical protein [Motilimonas cestriensis]MCE2597100.1 hypothetical protein [Motilimonas cestriensis]